jgi:hypothetical protein
MKVRDLAHVVISGEKISLCVCDKHTENKEYNFDEKFIEQYGDFEISLIYVKLGVLRVCVLSAKN